MGDMDCVCMCACVGWMWGIELKLISAQIIFIIDCLYAQKREKNVK